MIPFIKPNERTCEKCGAPMGYEIGSIADARNPVCGTCTSTIWAENTVECFRESLERKAGNDC